MARKKKKDDLDIAKQYRDLLLYELTGGNMGKKPENPVKKEVATFGEKRGFLDSMIKIAALERKEPSDEDDNVFDAIKKGLENGSSKSGSRRNPWGTKSPEPESDPASYGTGSDNQQESDDSEEI